MAREAGAWVHVDGAFGLWAAASPSRAHLVDGVDGADSWALDCHKWLNVPYDSGVAFCRNPEHLRAAMSATAAYLQTGDQREPGNYTPEMSRRARGVEIWAAIRSLGRAGSSGPHRAKLPARHPLCGGAARRRIRGAERGGSQPGPRLLRRCRDHEEGDRWDSGRWNLLVWRHRLAGPHRHEDQRIFVGDH